MSPPPLTMGKCPDSTWQARRFGDVAEFRHLQGFRGVYRGVVPGSQHWGFPKCYTATMPVTLWGAILPLELNAGEAIHKHVVAQHLPETPVVL